MQNNQAYPNTARYQNLLRFSSDDPTFSSSKGQRQPGWFQKFCCDAKDRVEVDLKCEIWSIFTSILIVVSIIAVIITVDVCEQDVVTVWNHAIEECNEPEGF